jgi:hypothetical protein
MSPVVDGRLVPALDAEANHLRPMRRFDIKVRDLIRIAAIGDPFPKLYGIFLG